MAGDVRFTWLNTVHSDLDSLSMVMIITNWCFWHQLVLKRGSLVSVFSGMMAFQKYAVSFFLVSAIAYQSISHLKNSFVILQYHIFAFTSYITFKSDLEQVH